MKTGLLSAVIFMGMCSLHAHAAAPEAAFHAVVNVDLIPADAKAGTQLLLGYMQKARQNPALAAITLIQQNGSYNHFILDETFRSEADYRDFVSSAAVRSFREAIYPNLGSPWDERTGREIEH